MPKKIILIISDNIVSLLEEVNQLIQQQRIRTSKETITTNDGNSEDLIEAHLISDTSRDVSSMIEGTTRNEYHFMNLCHRLFNYRRPEEIILSNENQPPEYGYVIPISQTLVSLFNHEFSSKSCRA